MSKLIEDYMVEKEFNHPDHIQEEGCGWQVFFNGVYTQDQYVSVQDVMKWMYEKKVLDNAP